MNRLDRRQGNTGFRPKAGHENLPASAFLDRGDKVFVVPPSSWKTLDGFLPREIRLAAAATYPLKDFVSTVVKTTGTSNPLRPFRCHGCCDDSLAVEIGLFQTAFGPDVDQRHDAIVRSQESLLTSVLDDCRLMIVEPYDFHSPFN